MKADQIKARLLAEGPVCILPSELDRMCMLAEDLCALAQFKAHGERAIEAARASSNRGNGVAVVPVYGAIAQKSSLWSAMFGGTSTDDLSAIVSKLAGDKSIGCVVFDIHSPGGTVAGIPELASQISDLGQSKKTVAVSNSQAASAAYWLACQAGSIAVTPSGEVGSVGVYAMHMDMSKALEAAGVSVTYISAGKNKTEGNPYQPLSDEARSAMQERVDDYNGMFVKAVASGRGVAQAKVNSDFGQGRVYGAADAVKRGMADSVATLDQVLSKVGGDRMALQSARVSLANRIAETL